MLGTPGLAAKSSISSLSRKPRPSAVTREPKSSFKVVVTETVFPAGSNGVVGCVYGFVDCGCFRIHGCVLLKLAENLRALQILTCACVGWINRLAPGRGIPLIDELG